MTPPRTVAPADALTAEERQRYARQLALPEIGEVGQRRLKGARVVVVGAGGLGSPVLASLAGAGVGTIVVVDDDIVDVSNLHRQTLHASAALGTAKAASAVAVLGRLNPLVEVVPVTDRLDATNAAEIIAGADVIVDGTDTFGTHLAVAAAAEAAGIPIVWGSALGVDGQVTVFSSEPGAATLADLYPEPPLDDAGGCQVAGILGPVCAAVGGVMAVEAIKLLVGFGRSLDGRLLVLDALDQTWRDVPYRAR